MIMIYQSYKGLEFLKRRESCKLEAYLDVAKIPTIGYGSTHMLDGSLVQLGDKISQITANLLIRAECESIVHKLEVAIITNLKQCQADSLVSFVYNIGITAFRSSTLLRIINANVSNLHFIEASKELEFNFIRWNRAHRDGKLIAVKGLTNRRRMEYNLFISTSDTYYDF